MRIAWCTPFHPQSAIGRFSQIVVEELLEGAEVDVWHPPAAETIDTPARRIPLQAGPADAARLDAYDVCIYNLGNHLGNHRAIFEASRLTPGIVVLHDLVLQDFFRALLLDSPDGRQRYSDAMGRWYGAHGLATAADILDGAGANTLETAAVMDIPLFEEAVAGAYGVVAHSAFAARRVETVFPGIVRSLPLAYKPLNLAAAPRENLRVPAGRALAVTIGDVNPNKRIQSVLTALGSDRRLAERLLYVVVGGQRPDHAAELSRLVSRYGLESSVRFTGYASEELLASYLLHADFCITLRHPPFETASGSAIQQMAAGKPLIVSDTGFYMDLPDDCVLKVRIEHEAEDLVSAIRQLVEDGPKRRRMGERAREFSRNTFRADRYAQGILQMSAEALDARPLLAFTDRIGRELARMGISSGEPLVGHIAELADELFGDNRR